MSSRLSNPASKSVWPTTSSYICDEVSNLDVAAAETLRTVHPRFQMSTACVRGRLKANSGGCSERGVFISLGRARGKEGCDKCCC